MATQPTKCASLRCYFPLMIISTQKNLRDRSIPFRNIDDQTILQSDWTRGTSGHTQPKVVVSEATFLISMEKI